MRIYPESDLVSLLQERKPNRIPHKFSFAARATKRKFCGMTAQFVVLNPHPITKLFRL
jgi:hypothetical protein